MLKITDISKTLTGKLCTNRGLRGRHRPLPGADIWAEKQSIKMNDSNNSHDVNVFMSVEESVCLIGESIDTT